MDGAGTRCRRFATLGGQRLAVIPAVALRPLLAISNGVDASANVVTLVLEAPDLKRGVEAASCSCDQEEKRPTPQTIETSQWRWQRD